MRLMICILMAFLIMWTSEASEFDLPVLEDALTDHHCRTTDRLVDHISMKLHTLPENRWANYRVVLECSVYGLPGDVAWISWEIHGTNRDMRRAGYGVSLSNGVAWSYTGVLSQGFYVLPKRGGHNCSVQSNHCSHTRALTMTLAEPCSPCHVYLIASTGARAIPVYERRRAQAKRECRRRCSKKMARLAESPRRPVLTIDAGTYLDVRITKEIDHAIH